MSQRPSGFVAFLFTDIENSTKHYHAMASAMTRHDELLRHAVDAHRGVVFKTVGDAVCAAFTTVADALAAAEMGQRSLADESWGETGGLRVRMAVHAGRCEKRDHDYFGPTVNRVARLLAAGHGGQVLVSQAAVVALASMLGDLTLRDLGDRRLKDLTQPEHVFQLIIPDLPDAFPPFNTLDARPNNLPARPTQLRGREAELVAINAKVRTRGTRTLTLTGPGGTGKTRLALQVAADLIDDFPHGVWFVDLATTSDPTLVLAEIARALGVCEEGDDGLEVQLVAHLRERELLLTLDNFEHVLAATKGVSQLLAACPKLKLLVTSRAPLRLTGEWEFPVLPLPVPDPKRLPPLNQLEAFPSVELFVERARTVKPAFALTAEEAAVAQICAALDGLPLAIELAAQVRLLAPRAMLPMLEQRLKLLTGGARDKPTRQQTPRDTIAWSVDLLSELACIIDPPLPSATGSLKPLTPRAAAVPLGEQGQNVPPCATAQTGSHGSAQ